MSQVMKLQIVYFGSLTNTNKKVSNMVFGDIENLVCNGMGFYVGIEGRQGFSA